MQKGISYTTILHQPRIKAGLTCNQYVLASTIFHMQNNTEMPGWCYATKDWFAEMLGVSKQSVINLINQLCELGFVQKNDNGRHLKVTKRWINEIENFDFGKESLPNQKKQTVKKVYQNGKESLPNDGKESLPETVKKVYPIIIEENNTKKIIENDNSPNGVFSESEIEDFEKQAAAIRTDSSLEESETEKEKNLRQKKKNETKWNGSFQAAKDYFDKYRKTWMKKRHGVDGDPIYWNGMETGQLSNLLTALKSKSTDAGHVYGSDKDFIEAVLPVFLEYATRLDKYYMNEFTPTRFYSNFNTIYADIKILFTNGTSTTNGKRHGISQDFKNAIASQLD